MRSRRSRLVAALAVVTSALTCAQQAAPALDSVTMHEDDGGRYPVVYPVFHFHGARSSGAPRAWVAGRVAQRAI
jgi:hypothetical protein